MAEPALSVGSVATPALTQIALWPETAADAARRLAAALGVPLPAPGASAPAGDGRLLRVEPLVWWLLGASAPELPPEEGATLDLSQARALIRVEGARAAELLARFTAVDLRAASFPDGAVAATGMLHSPVVLLRRDAERPGYDLLPSRSFAGAIRDALLHHAAQFA